MAYFKEIFMKNPIVCVTIEENLYNVFRKNFDAQKYVKYTAQAQIRKQSSWLTGRTTEKVTLELGMKDGYEFPDDNDGNAFFQEKIDVCVEMVIEN